MPAVRLHDFGDFDEVGTPLNCGLAQQCGGALARALIAGETATLAVRHFDFADQRSSRRRVLFLDANLLRLWADRRNRGDSVARLEPGERSDRDKQGLCEEL